MHRNISVFFFILLMSSCSRLENKFDPAAYDCGIDKGQMARPILGKDLKSLDASQIEVFSGQDDRTFKRADHLLSPKGCLLPNKESPTFIRTRDRSMMQVIEEFAGTDPIVLETVSLPPLVGICPDLLYTKDQSILFNQILPRGFPTRFGGLLTTDVKLLDHDKVVQEWKSLRVDELQSLKLSDSTSLGRGSYVLQFLQKNFLLDSFDQQYTCKVRVDSSPLQVLLSDAIQDKRRVGGKDVFFVDPGYTLDFFVVQGFRDVSIEYCAEPLGFSELLKISNVQRSCDNPQSFLEKDGLPLQEGYQAVTYRARKGNTQTDWITQYVGVRVPCSGTLRDGDLQLKALAPGAKNCTDLLANLVIETPLVAASSLKLQEISSMTGDLTIKKQGGHDLHLNLNRVNGNVTISATDSKDLELLPNLSFVLGGLTIADNNSLESTDGLGNLKFAGSLRIEKNPNLARIQLTQLEATSDAVLTKNKGQLLSLPALLSVERLYMNGNTESVAIDGLSNLKRARVLSFSGPMLRSLPAFPKLETLEFLEIGPAQIRKLPPLPIPSLSSLTLRGLIDFDFRSLPFRSITQDLHLTQMNSLRNLEVLRSINFSQKIRLVIEENNQLESLSGLESLKQVETLFIRKNPLLTDLSALNSLQSAQDISIVDNAALQSIQSFDELSSVQVLTIQSNPDLQSISGFANLQELGSVAVNASKDLILSGFDKVRSMDQLVVLSSAQAPTVRLDLKAFQNLKNLKKSLILDMPLTEDSRLMPALTSIDGKLGGRVAGDCVPQAYQTLRRFARNLVADADLSIEKDNTYLSVLSRVFGSSFTSAQALPATFFYQASNTIVLDDCASQ